MTDGRIFRLRAFKKLLSLLEPTEDVHKAYVNISEAIRVIRTGDRLEAAKAYQIAGRSVLKVRDAQSDRWKQITKDEIEKLTNL